MEAIFGTKTKAQEIILLLNDVKQVVRQGFYPSELEKVEKFCREKGLFLVKSRFKVVLDGQGNYSNKGIRVKDSQDGMYFVYISKDEEKALLASYYELIQDDKNLGLILGYPSCCVNFFCKTFSVNNTNPVKFSDNIFTNLSKRDEDLVIISHFPCSADCKESIKLGKEYLAVLKKVDIRRAETLRSVLTEEGQ